MDKKAWKSTSLEWTEDVSPAGKSPILHWNGLMENALAGSFPYFGRKIKPSPKWTDGCPSSREVSHTSMEWTDGNALAGSFPYFREIRPSMQSQVEEQLPNGKTCALSPPTNTEEDHLIIEKKLTALVEL